MTPAFDRMANADEEEMNALCAQYDFPNHLLSASPEVLALSYQPLSEEQIADLDALGPGSRLLQIQRDTLITTAAKEQKRRARMLDADLDLKGDGEHPYLQIDSFSSLSFPPL